MKIAITAASGNLGTEIVQACIDRVGANNVVGLARTPAKAQHLGIEIRPGDYSDNDSLQASLQSIDAVVLVSGMDAPDQRIVQHRNVINAAKSNGVNKIVYTSVQGADEGTAFSPIIQSNRQTEQDVRESGMDWVIGRNGIYIEPDIDYIDTYRSVGAIRNCAADGLCGYTTRPELGYAYASMLLQSEHNGQTYNLNGDAITQTQLAEYLNLAFGTTLQYESMSVEAYRAERVAELGEFLGTVIAGIYQGIREGKSNNPSHYQQAAGRAHIDWPTYFKQLAQSDQYS